jgi:hypothetical protein
MATGKGVIQGYTGLAAIDAAHQIIVEAQAHGSCASEFVHDTEARTCVCPAGKSLNRNGHRHVILTTSGKAFSGRRVTVLDVHSARSVFGIPRRRGSAP